MKKKSQKKLWKGAGLLLAFVLWTVLVRTVDTGEIGPENTSVGFASLNGFVHNLIGVNMSLYNLTDLLGLVPFGFVLGFAVLGLVQWLRRKSLRRVDRSILLLGGFYVVVLAIYVLFEMVPVNYRPVLINGVLEVSYPSSTTMLVMCVMPTAAMQLKARIGNSVLRHAVVIAVTLFTAFMVTGRILSGVHWITDILGGVMLSAGLAELYGFFLCKNGD